MNQNVSNASPHARDKKTLGPLDTILIATTMRKVCTVLTSALSLFFLWILTSRNSYTPVDVFDTFPKVLFQLFVEQQVQLSAAHLVILPGLPLQDCILDPINFKIFLQTGWSPGQPGISNRKLTNQGSKTRALTLPKVLFNVISIDGNLAL